ncbi:MAG TPA: helix-turn-helix domain-containing protein [Gammaproteobacteria bacterium]|nr:helix-turn-helix domain-containing protein [Gammaproteobacteria bacterium]
MSYRVTLLALEGCFASNVAGAIDLFDTANQVAARQDPSTEPIFTWQVLSPGGQPVRASSGCMLAVDGPVDGAPPARLIMIPAFGSPRPSQLAAAIGRYTDLIPWLRAQHEAGVAIAATCSGSFLLAESGLLDGRRATTSWWLADAFAERYANVDLDVTAMVTDNDDLLCSGAGMSHLDLSLHIIERVAGRDIAHQCARYVVLDDQRRSQAPYIILNHIRSHDPVVVKAEQWIRANLNRTLRVEDIAEQVAVSPRTLIRRFKEHIGDTPQAFVRKARIEAGKALLENTNLRLSEIVERLGYEDASTFRRAFKRYTDLSPRDYRRRFGAGR